MSRREVVIVDYGMGNLLSVRRAFEHCGAAVRITADPSAILSADKVVLPGVGAFANGMAELRRLGLDAVLQEVARNGTPLLGICLGMQMLLDDSEEFGVTTGLGLIAGRVVPVPRLSADGRPQKIPHIGWNALVPPRGLASWDGSPLQDITPGDAVYFVHSYMAKPTDPAHLLASCVYGGAPVSAAIARKNVFGCQFHPEKSGEVGLTIIRSFIG
jgi:glutamine amidotransferase